MRRPCLFTSISGSACQSSGDLEPRPLALTVSKDSEDELTERIVNELKVSCVETQKNQYNPPLLRFLRQLLAASRSFLKVNSSELHAFKQHVAAEAPSADMFRLQSF